MQVLKRASWLRRRIELWMMRRYLLRYGPQMFYRRGCWWYVDPHGTVYEVRPTGEVRGVPLTITMISEG